MLQLRGAKVPESEFKTLPNGLKLVLLYDNISQILPLLILILTIAYIVQTTWVCIDVNLNLGTSVSYDHSLNLYIYAVCVIALSFYYSKASVGVFDDRLEFVGTMI